MTKPKHRILIKYSLAYLTFAASLALADALLTDYLLNKDSNVIELNLKIDSSSLSGLLGGVATSMVIFFTMFLVSTTMHLNEYKKRNDLQLSSRWDKLGMQMLGTVSVWYLLLSLGAVLNNAGMALFEFSWLQSIFSLVGLNTSNEQLAGYALFPMVSLAGPSFLIYLQIANKAKTSLRMIDIEG